VNCGNHASAIAGEQDRQAIGGHHRNAHADLLRNHRIRLESRTLPSALLRGDDCNTVHLTWAPQARGFCKAAQAETVIDSDARQQRVSKQLRGAHF
jgi:hypothetical protein